ncbi:MAG: OadG family protein [Clostridia bacterium]|nr:OadG family protein [Clostridia bacterium]MBQ8369944.1 OadG family protein [Clostridia bacterium]MBQ8512138.1 OadG family protein [Clostridia bacterium]
MTYLPLFLTANGLDLTEKLALSGEMLLKGMGTVFLVLAILWGIIALFSVFAGTAEKKPAPEKKPAAPAKKAEPKPEAKPAPAAAPAPAQTDDGALIAAITAAIEAYRAEEGLSGLPYRVVSFKRKSGKKSWTGTSED